MVVFYVVDCDLRLVISTVNGYDACGNAHVLLSLSVRERRRLNVVNVEVARAVVVTSSGLT